MNRFAFVSIVTSSGILLSSARSSTVVAASEGQQQSQSSWRVRGSRLQGTEKVIHFVRHAEGYHNVAGKNDPINGYLNKALIDADLTEEGVAQCMALRQQVQTVVSGAELLVVSPMNRTIKTAQNSFPQLEHSIPWIALEEIRERTGRHWCDKRHSLTQLRARYPLVNFDHVANDEDPLFHLYTDREPNEDIIKRAHQFVDWLARRPEKEIVVVSHSGFLAFLLCEAMQLETTAATTKFDNCEMRSFLVSFDKVK